MPSERATSPVLIASILCGAMLMIPASRRHGRSGIVDDLDGFDVARRDVVDLAAA
jgi:hypothetical protein